MVLYFDASDPDWVDCSAADSANLDFVGENFSISLWANMMAAATRTLLCRGVANTDGWLMQVSNTGRLGFATFQAGGTQSTYSTATIITSTWYLFGITRVGASVRTYINGIDCTDAPDTHVDPDSATRELHVGILDDETSDPWYGEMGHIKVYPKALESWEHMELFNMERHLLGV
jgi:hypothetical protein